MSKNKTRLHASMHLVSFYPFTYVFYTNAIFSRSKRKKGLISINNKLRNEVKLLKALSNISYKEIASYLEITPNSFYSWLKGYYNFGDIKLTRLLEIISTLKE